MRVIEVPGPGWNQRTFDARVATGDLELIEQLDAEPAADDLDALRAEAAALGVKVHGNAGSDTLRRRIEEARAAQVAPATE